MKKKYISFFLTFLLFASLAAPYVIESMGVGIVIDGKAVEFNKSTGTPFIDDSGRTQVPLRATMEAFGCSVDWSDKTYSAIVSKNNTTITVPINKNYILKNNKKIQNDTVAQIKDGRTYLPIRVVLEAFGGYVGWDGKQNSVTVSTKSPLVQVHFIDVGQGDSAMIDCGSFEILIDGGDNDYGDTVAQYIKPYVDGNIEVVIATHPDADHIGGLDTVLNSYKVDRIIDSGYMADTKTYSDYMLSVKNQKAQFENDSNISIQISPQVYFNIIETGDNWSNSNDMSVVAKLCYENTSVLFTGDISSNVENEIVSMIGDADVLKVAHHGSKSSTSKSFLDAVKPEYAVVSAGLNNRYNHPSSDVLKRLNDLGTKTLGTFKDENIILNINEDGFSFNKSSYLGISDSGDLTDGEISNNSVASSNTNGLYVGNKNTKTFHFSNCMSVSSISEANKLYISSRNIAVSAGFKPCKRCNP